MSDRDVQMVTARACAGSDQMWEGLKAKVDEVASLQSKMKRRIPLVEYDNLLLDYIISAVIYEIRFRNLDQLKS